MTSVVACSFIFIDEMAEPITGVIFWSESSSDVTACCQKFVEAKVNCYFFKFSLKVCFALDIGINIFFIEADHIGGTVIIPFFEWRST
jgi:hypothetical protein